MTRHTSPDVIAILRERLRHECDMGRLDLIARMSAVEEDKLRKFAFYLTYMPLSSELNSIHEVMEQTHTIVLESDEFELQDGSMNERRDPYNQIGRKVK